MYKLGKSTAQMQHTLQYVLEIILFKKLLCLSGTTASKAGKTAGRRASHLETFNFRERWNKMKVEEDGKCQSAENISRLQMKLVSHMYK